jgi:hypothetical protein
MTLPSCIEDGTQLVLNGGAATEEDVRVESIGLCPQDCPPGAGFEGWIILSAPLNMTHYSGETAMVVFEGQDAGQGAGAGGGMPIFVLAAAAGGGVLLLILAAVCWRRRRERNKLTMSRGTTFLREEGAPDPFAETKTDAKYGATSGKHPGQHTRPASAWEPQQPTPGSSMSSSKPGSLMRSSKSSAKSWARWSTDSGRVTFGGG